MTTSTLRRLHVGLPRGFVRLPMTTSAMDEVRAIVEIARQSGYEVADPTQTVHGFTEWTHQVPTAVQVVGKFAVKAGEVHTAATLVLAIHPVPAYVRGPITESSAPLVNAIQEVFRKNNPLADTRIVSLPIGPAMVALLFGGCHLSAKRGSTNQPPVVPVLRIQFLIPLPTGQDLAVLDVSTTNDAAWPMVALTTAAIARSLTDEPRA